MVPFHYHSGVSTTQRALFRKAMAEIEAVSQVQFVPYNSQANRILIRENPVEANAVCVSHCSEVFRVNEDDTLTILEADPPERLRAQVEEAVRLCPRQALRLEN